jgi:DNA-binding response OmpR family regulator
MADSESWRTVQGGSAIGAAGGPAGGPTGAKRLLLVDDDMLMRRMAARTLRHAGFEVVEAGDGEQGLAQFALQPFDGVLLDLEMPGIGGHEVCARLRGTASGARLPILILSGRDDAESIARARQQGATDFIGKPIDWPALAARVHAALRAASAAPAGRVLLACANVQRGAVIAATLREAGATVSLVDNSPGAVESALQNDFDLVLLDAALPLIGGSSAARVLRACGHRRPIIALTAGPAERSEADGGSADREGIDGALPLAADGAQLRAMLRHHLAAGAASANAPLGPAYWEELARHGARFRQGLPAQMAAMRGALQGGQWPALLSLAHALKGAAGSFGLGRLTELAGAIEAELRAGRTAGVATLCDALFNATQSALAPPPGGET